MSTGVKIRPTLLNKLERRTPNTWFHTVLILSPLASQASLGSSLFWAIVPLLVMPNIQYDAEYTEWNVNTKQVCISG